MYIAGVIAAIAVIIIGIYIKSKSKGGKYSSNSKNPTTTHCLRVLNLILININFN